MRFPARPRAADAGQATQNIRELNDLVLEISLQMQKGDLDQARQLVMEGRARFCDAPELREIDAEIEKARAFEPSVAKARQPLKTQPAEYERQRIYDRRPGEPVPDAPHHSEQGASLRHEEQASMDALMKELDAMFPRGDAYGVSRGAKEVFSKHNDSRAMELPAWGEASIAQSREFDGKSRSPGSLWLWGAICGVGLAALITALIRNSPPPPAPITVIPNEVSFYYAKGDPIPKPRSFEITARRPDQRWITASSDPWLRVSKASGTGTSYADVTIDAAQLSAGEYVGVVTVSSGSDQKNLIVNLSVTGPPETASAETLSASELGITPEFGITPELRIAPQYVRFTYEKGSPLPAVQRVKIISFPPDQSWKVIGKEDWVLLSKDAGEGSSEVEVRADPSKLAAGDYVSSVRIESGAGVKVFNVHLGITEPATVFGPVVDCHGDQYNGRYTGTIAWSGMLNNGEALTITGKNIASTGNAHGRELPGCPVSVAPVAGLDIQDPSSASNYRQIRVTNRSGHPIDSIRVTWNVKE